MAVSIKERTQYFPNVEYNVELRLLLEALVESMETLSDKLDADAGVTDTDYAATLATIVEK